MPRKRKADDMKATQNVRLTPKAQTLLSFLAQMSEATMSEIVESLIHDKYPNIERQRREWEKSQRTVKKELKIGEGDK